MITNFFVEPAPWGGYCYISCQFDEGPGRRVVIGCSEVTPPYIKTANYMRAMLTMSDDLVISAEEDFFSLKDFKRTSGIHPIFANHKVALDVIDQIIYVLLKNKEHLEI